MAMKPIPSLFLCLTLVSAQAQFTDNFSDGELLTNPAWTGDHSKFTVASNQLKLSAPAVSDVAYLSTASQAINDATWEFWVRMDFNPSASNLARVYLASNISDLTSALNGYYVLIGDSPDEVSLYRQTGSTSTKIIDGLDGTVNLASPIVKIKVTRDHLGNWELYRDVNATGTYQFEGNSFDNTHKASSYFGILCEYTATRSDKFLFDDFAVTGNPFVDTDPPQPVNVNVVSDKVLSLEFDEPLEITSASIHLHYQLDLGLGNPQTAELQPDGKTVKLTWSQALQNGKTHRLTTTGVMDVNGNVLVNGSIDFLYFQPVDAVPRDLIFTEVLADPSPVVGLPEAEYAEILNRSPHPFDLAGWTLTDGSSTATLNPQLVQPGDYWVITSSANAVLFSGINVIGVANFPTLNNSGDQLVLKSPSGLTVDSIKYALSWYRDEDKQEGGWSLELINPEDICSFDKNWSASLNSMGGTPGVINSIFSDAQDITGPGLIRAVAISSNQLRLDFSERLREDVLTTLALQANPQLSVLSTSFVDDGLSSIHIVLDAPMEKQVEYDITVEGVFDCPGNPIASEDGRTSFYYLQDVDVASKDVIFTEIMADPDPAVGLPPVEYLEILNRTNKPLDLAAWSLEDETGVTSLPSAILLPNALAVLTAVNSVAGFHPDLPIVGVNNFPTLNNGGESLRLRSPSGQTVDSVRFALDWYRDVDKQQGGWSLEIIDPENPCGEEDNWAASENHLGGTPGAANSIHANKPDLTGPTLLNIQVVDSITLRLIFNEKLERQVVNQAQVIINPLAVIKSLKADSTFRELTICLSEPLRTRQLYTIIISNLFDCNGNPMAEGANEREFALPEIASAGELVLNEVLFNPRPTGVDFIELWNLTDKFISLKNLYVSDTEPGGQALVPTIDYDYVVKPTSLVVLTPDPEKLSNEYPRGDMSTFLKTDLPSMPDREGRVVVVNQRGETIDILSYDEGFHSPLIRDAEGISLERISPQQPNTRENWRSATAASGFATPGWVNSNFVADIQSPSGEVVIEPEIIAPGSGFRDYAQVRYQFDQTGLAVSVKVFNQQGQLIKTLANNEIINAMGFFRWDGDQDDGSRARLGYYFIWFEVFGTDGFTKTYRKRVVIAAR